MWQKSTIILQWQARPWPWDTFPLNPGKLRFLPVKDCLWEQSFPVCAIRSAGKEENADESKYLSKYDKLQQKPSGN